MQKMQIKNPTGQFVPTNNQFFRSIFEFPRKEAVEKLKNQGKLKAETKVVINEEKNISGGDFIVCWEREIFSMALYFGIWFLILVGKGLLKHFNLVPADLLLILYLCFLGALIVSFFVISMKFGKKSENLGDLFDSDDFVGFLDKFAKKGFLRKLSLLLGVKVPLEHKLKRIPLLGIFWGGRRWQIKYSVLVEAYDFFKQNPDEFKEAVKNAKNLEKFIMLVGIR